MKLVTLLITLAMLVSLPSLAHANLLSNPGFETAGAGGDQDAANWTEADSAGRENWANRTDSWGMATRSWVNGGLGNAYQEVAGSANYDYSFSIWGTRDAGTPTGTYYLKLGFYQGASLLDEVSNLNVALTDTVWTQFSLSGASPSGTDIVRVTLGSTTNSVVGKFDDADLTGQPIPEPTSLLLLGSGLVGLLALRKRTIK